MRIIFLLMLFTVSAESQSFTGKVFIVTKGKSVFRLPLVEINIYELTSFQKTLKERITLTRNTKNTFSYDTTLIDSLTKIKNTLRPQIQSITQDFANKNIDYGIYRRQTDSLLELVRPVEIILGENDKREKLYLDWISLTKRPEYYFANLGKPLFKTKTDDEGIFSLSLKQGVNYALVAISERDIGGTTEQYYWMIRIIKHSKTIILSNDNLFETECDECLLKLSTLPY